MCHAAFIKKQRYCSDIKADRKAFITNKTTCPEIENAFLAQTGHRLSWTVCTHLANDVVLCVFLVQGHDGRDDSGDLFFQFVTGHEMTHRTHCLSHCQPQLKETQRHAGQEVTDSAVLYRLFTEGGVTKSKQFKKTSKVKLSMVIMIWFYFPLNHYRRRPKDLDGSKPHAFE